MGPPPTDKSADQSGMTTRSTINQQGKEGGDRRDSLEQRFDSRFLKLEKAMAAMAQSVAAAVAPAKKAKKKRKRDEPQSPEAEQPR